MTVKTLLALLTVHLMISSFIEQANANGLDGWPVIERRDLTLYADNQPPIRSRCVKVLSFDFNFNKGSFEQPADAQYCLKTDRQIELEAVKKRLREEKEKILQQRLKTRSEREEDKPRFKKHCLSDLP